MKPKTMLAAGAVAVSIAAGAGAGALLFTPSSSIAQTASSSGPATTPGYGGGGGGGGKAFGMRAGGGAELGVAATAIGITEDQLRTELKAGKTIAQVAQAHNVDVQKVIDALVADAKAKLQQAETDLPTRIADMVNGKTPLGGGGFGGRPGGPLGGMKDVIGQGLDTAATTIGITQDQLKTELQSGKSIADVAKAHSVDPQKVIDALTAAANKKLDDAVTAGTITSDQATKIKSNLSQMITAMVNGQRPPMGGRGGHRGPAGANGSTPSQTPQAGGAAYTS
jgi:ribosomal protein S20